MTLLEIGSLIPKFIFVRECILFGVDKHMAWILLTVLEIRQPRGSPNVNSKLDLTLFGIGAPSRVLTQLPYIFIDFPWL